VEEVEEEQDLQRQGEQVVMVVVEQVDKEQVEQELQLQLI
jgi:hypothetical protein